MSEYKPVTVAAARQISEAFDKQVVVIVCLDAKFDKTHTTTYGCRPADKVIAARLGEFLAQAVGCDMQQRNSHEDFRTVDAAMRAREIEVLSKKLAITVIALEKIRNANADVDPRQLAIDALTLSATLEVEGPV